MQRLRRQDRAHRLEGHRAQRPRGVPGVRLRRRDQTRGALGPGVARPLPDEPRGHRARRSHAGVGVALLSAALANKAHVQVRRGWTEPLNTYLVVGLDSGNRKTRVVDDVVAPIAAHEAKLLADAAVDIAEARSRERILKATLDRAEK